MARKFFTAISILLVIAVTFWIIRYNDQLEGKTPVDYSAMVETLGDSFGESIDSMLSEMGEMTMPDLELETKGEELYQSFTEEVADEPKEAADNLIRRKIEEFFSGMQERFTTFIDGLLHG